MREPCRGIVYSIPDHPNPFVFLNKGFNYGNFVLGQQFCVNFFDADFGCDGLRRGPIVTCEHDQMFDASGSQFIQYFTSARPNLIGQSD